MPSVFHAAILTAEVFVVETDLEHVAIEMPFHHGLACLHGPHMSVARHAHGPRVSFFFCDATYAPLADTS